MSTFVGDRARHGGRRLPVRRWRDSRWLIGGALMAIAVVGIVTSLRHPARAGSRAAARLSRGIPFGEIWHGLVRLWRDRDAVADGRRASRISGSSARCCRLALHAVRHGRMGLSAMGRHAALRRSLAIGIGVGSLAAGRLSGDKVELGLVPIGAFGMGMFAICCSARATRPTSRGRERWRCSASPAGCLPCR